MKNNVPYLVPLVLVVLALSISLIGTGQALSLVSSPDAPHQAVISTVDQIEKGMSLEKALDRIKQQYQVKFGYDESIIQGKQVTSKVSLQQPLEQQLSQLLAPFGLEYKKLDHRHYVIKLKEKGSTTMLKLSSQSVRLPTMFLDDKVPTRLTPSQPTSAANSRSVDKTISGTVTDIENGETLPGVNVLAKNTTIGTVTDVDGNYSLSVPDDAQVLIFSSVGYTSEEVAIGNQTTINVDMVPDIQSLSEVVVIGYGTQKKSDLTGSVVSVPSEEITAYPVEGAVQALQGRAAGVQIQSNNGEPGANPKVRIRGGTSINAGSDPLYVIDGFIGGVLPPPEDIASIEVLKDASATAIYGSRGANGVIMVTTKRGKSGTPQISLSTSYSTQEEINRLDLLGREDYINYVSEVNPNYVPGDASTDWQDVIFQPGNIQNYQLSVSGGNDNVKYYVSGTYFDQKGVIVNSDFNRLSITSNVDIKASERVKIGLNLLSRRRSRDGVRTQESSGGATGTGVIASAFKFGPDLGIYNPDGSFTLAQLGQPHDNPFAIATERINESQEDRLQVNTYAEFDIVEGLKFRTTWGASTENEQIGEYIPTTLQDGIGVGGEGQVQGVRRTLYLTENYLTYNRQFGTIHDLTVMGGYSYQGSEYKDWRARGQGFVSDADTYQNLNGASVWLQPESNFNDWQLSSFYGRVNYTLAEKYLFTFNARYDGSSRLSADNKWSFFPSGAIAWNITEERFLQDNEWLSFLKLRGSYGLTGNQSINPYQTQASFGSLLSVIDGTPVNSVVPTQVASEDLTWETTTQLNVGADFGFLEDRITATVDWYQMETNDLLFSRNLPSVVGVAAQLINLGTVKNRGIELSLNSRNISGPFTWDMGINFSRNRNEVVSLPDGNDIQYGAAPGHLVGIDFTNILREGQPVGTFYGWIDDGVYQESDGLVEGEGPQPGDVRLRDINGRDEEGNLTGQPDGVVNNDDRTIIGDPNPDFIWGLNNTFKWKGFDLNIFFQASQGNDILSFTLMELDLAAGTNNATTAVLDRWTPTNTDTDVPRAAPRDARTTTRWIRDGSYVRLKNLALGYNFANSFLERFRIERLRLYVSAQNILTFTDYEGYDPEVNYRSSNNQDSNRNLGLDYGSYPNAKAYTVGLNLTF
ncbi:SusC/RagA family TonB-linked outer membrane protein [Tunicatimonas pelagia]|uniref:SusC/RagA family TonB-linked outer membrane protein n=1 Tax=Tunicatimonas pelagia TaxID=931531 RepID=UPI002665BFA4|nr:SusC/RagA family TonB-linked outer membrane protein [Tunicatimonas pelagia]WKN44953.1 SusC/RagA family TonB-linked outer membrane protein [Tunicatimonas pelagia]